MLPLRWTSPEALETNLFSAASDVFSFGIVAVEVYTDGAMPYGHWGDAEVVRQVKEGYKIRRPENCPYGRHAPAAHHPRTHPPPAHPPTHHHRRTARTLPCIGRGERGKLGRRGRRPNFFGSAVQCCSRGGGLDHISSRANVIGQCSPGSKLICACDPLCLRSDVALEMLEMLDFRTDLYKQVVSACLNTDPEQRPAFKRLAVTLTTLGGKSGITPAQQQEQMYTVPSQKAEEELYDEPGAALGLAVPYYLAPAASSGPDGPEEEAYAIPVNLPSQAERESRPSRSLDVRSGSVHEKRDGRPTPAAAAQPEYIEPVVAVLSDDTDMYQVPQLASDVGAPALLPGGDGGHPGIYIMTQQTALDSAAIAAGWSAYTQAEPVPEDTYDQAPTAVASDAIYSEAEPVPEDTCDQALTAVASDAIYSEGFEIAGDVRQPRPKTWDHLLAHSISSPPPSHPHTYARARRVTCSYQCPCT